MTRGTEEFTVAISEVTRRHEGRERPRLFRALLAVCLAASGVVAVSVTTPASAGGAPRGESLRVVAFNVLAPPWADPAQRHDVRPARSP
ncbi:MAG: hypothetical protein ACO3AV_06435, partial [Ilumatobacteraceae bacterium]